MACDAAERLRELIAAGEEIPYEVREPGDGSPLCRYEPQTEIFVRDHARELRELDSFGTACAAIETAGLAARLPRADGGRRSRPSRGRAPSSPASPSSAGCGWAAPTSRSRTSASTPRSTSSRPAATSTTGEIEVIVPLRGLQMPVARLDLAPRRSSAPTPSTCRPRRAPADGLGVSPWEPPFLARRPGRRGRATTGETADAGRSRPSSAFRRLVTTLRLFKAGGVGARPARLDADRRRSLAPDRHRLRAPAPGRLPPDRGRARRAGRLLARAGDAGHPVHAPRRRPAGLPDHPRARAQPLRGRARAQRRRRGAQRLPAGAALRARGRRARRPRALDAGRRALRRARAPRRGQGRRRPRDRARARALERRARRREPGRRPRPRPLPRSRTSPGRSSRTPRAGHLGSDLRATADEILLADGLAVGDGAAEQRGGTTEWDLEPVAEEAPTTRPTRPSLEPLAEQSRTSRSSELELDAELDRRCPTRSRGGLRARRANLTRATSPEPEEEIDDRARARDLRQPDRPRAARPEPARSSCTRCPPSRRRTRGRRPRPSSRAWSTTRVARARRARCCA